MQGKEIWEGRYFPFLLGNGIDSVLVDYSGSMACDSGHIHLEQHQGAICAWYKSTHRKAFPDGKPIMPIIQTTYTLITDSGETLEIGDFDQHFDPIRAVLTTKVEATGFKLQIDTILCRGSVMVERYTVLDAPPNKSGAIALNLHPPYIHWSNSFYTFSADAEYSFLQNDSGIECKYQVNGIKGEVLCFTDYCGKVEYSTFRDGMRFVLSGLEPGASFSRYTVVLDEQDSSDYYQKCAAAVESARSKGYAAILDKHCREWTEYSSKSSIKIPDKHLQYLYDVSLYLARSHQNPATGLISLGGYPVLWGGGISNSWDLIFVMRALLTSNHIREAEKLIDGYKSILPIAKDYANKMGMPGAYFAWFMNHEGRSLDFSDPREFPDIEKFNNGCLVMEAWELFAHTGDKAVLERHWDLIKDTVDFLIACIVEEEDEIAWIREVEGADESVSRKNDTAHLLSTIKAVESLMNAACTLGKDIPPSYGRLLIKLKKGLKDNFKDGVLMPYNGAQQINTSLFSFSLFSLPEVLPKETVEAALKDCAGKLGLTNPGNYRNLIWPWAENNAAAALSYLCDNSAFEHLDNASKYTSLTGAFPEKIRPDGFPINYWYLTCHGSYIYALNSMLANSTGSKINILPGIPATWKTLSFENLRVLPGILVSLHMTDGDIQHLELTNTTLEDLKLILRFPNGREIPVCLHGAESMSII